MSINPTTLVTVLAALFVLIGTGLTAWASRNGTLIGKAFDEIDRLRDELEHKDAAVEKERDAKHEMASKAQAIQSAKDLAELEHEREMHKQAMMHADEVHDLVLNHREALAEMSGKVTALMNQVADLEEADKLCRERVGRLEKYIIATGASLPA